MAHLAKKRSRETDVQDIDVLLFDFDGFLTPGTNGSAYNQRFPIEELPWETVSTILRMAIVFIAEIQSDPKRRNKCVAGPSTRCLQYGQTSDPGGLRESTKGWIEQLEGCPYNPLQLAAKAASDVRTLQTSGECNLCLVCKQWSDSIAVPRFLPRPFGLVYCGSDQTPHVREPRIYECFKITHPQLGICNFRLYLPNLLTREQIDTEVPPVTEEEIQNLETGKWAELSRMLICYMAHKAQDGVFTGADVAEVVPNLHLGTVCGKLCEARHHCGLAVERIDLKGRRAPVYTTDSVFQLVTAGALVVFA